MNPSVSIISAVYNASSTIGDCIDSVCSQTLRDVEHIVIDGGSTDGTVDIIRNQRGRIARWISEPDNGIYDALNKGIQMATGKVIGFLHADDLYASASTLETIAGCFAQHHVDSCYGDLLYVDRADTGKTVRYWRSAPFDQSLTKQGWMPPHPTFFVRRQIYQKFGGFDTSFRIAADYELMMRYLGQRGISTTYIPEVLVKMRVGGASNRSLVNIIRKSSEDYRVMRRYNLGGFPTLVQKNVYKIPQFFK